MGKPQNLVCMLCGSSPCSCNSQKPKVAPRRASKQEEAPVESMHATAPSAAVEALRSAAARARHEQRIAALVPPDQPPATGMSEDEYALLAALRCLETAFGKVDGDDVYPYRLYLDQPQTIAERAAAWRVRRRWTGVDGDSS